MITHQTAMFEGIHMLRFLRFSARPKVSHQEVNPDPFSKIDEYFMAYEAKIAESASESEYKLSRIESRQFSDLSFIKAKLLMKKAASKWTSPQEKVKNYQHLVDQFCMSDDPRIHRVVTRAMLITGLFQEQLNQWDEAESSYEQLHIRFSYTQDVEMIPHLYNAALRRGSIYTKQEKFHKARVCYGLVIRHFNNLTRLERAKVLEFKLRDSGEIFGFVSEAALKQAEPIRILKGREHELRCYENLVESYVRYKQESMKSSVLKALDLKFRLQTKSQNEYQTNLKAYHEVYDKCEPLLAELTNRLLSRLD